MMMRKLVRAFLPLFVVTLIWARLIKASAMSSQLLFFQGSNLFLLANNLGYWLLVLVIYEQVWGQTFSQPFVQIRWQSQQKIRLVILGGASLYAALTVIIAGLCWWWLALAGAWKLNLLLLWLGVVLIVMLDEWLTIRSHSKTPLILGLCSCLILMSL